MNHRDPFPSRFRLDPWLVHPDLNRITGPDGDVQVEPRVMRVLLVLAERPGQVVTRERLLDEVWSDTVVGEEILTRAVSELRRIFGDDAREPRYIETIRHHGYRLIAPVEPEHAPAISPENRPEPDEASHGPAAPESPRPVAPAGGRLIPPFLAVAAALVLLAVYGPRLLDGDRTSPPVQPPRAVPVTSYPGREQYPALSPDGLQVAFAWAGPEGANIDIYLKQVGSEATLRLTDDPDWAAWPTWSPDGQTVACVQGAGSRSLISLVPALGGASRAVHEVEGWIEGLDWSPDGRHLAFSAPDPATGDHRLYLLSLDDLSAAALDVERGDSAGDIQPRFDPAGDTLAWIGLDQTGRHGLFTAPVSGGRPTAVHLGQAELQGLAWSADGSRLVYAAAPAGRFDLWQVGVAGGEAEWIPTPGDFAWNPTIARLTGDLVYEEVRADRDLWRIRIVGQDPWQLETEPFIRSTRWEYEADFSPDDRRVVFVSARSGRPELWVSDRDGGNLRQLTRLNAAAVSNPRWSPRGDRIAFNAVLAGNTEIRLVQARGGEPLGLGEGSAAGVFTGWCADGDHLLVRADRGDGWQIYRKSLAGGPDVRLTRTGGLTAAESPSGATLFFTRPGRPGLWRMGLGGDRGEDPVLILPDLQHRDRSNWRLVAAGGSPGKIAWVMRVQDSAFLMFHDLGKAQSTFLTELPDLAGPGLALTHSGEEILFARTQNMAGDLMLLEGERTE